MNRRGLKISVLQTILIDISSKIREPYTPPTTRSRVKDIPCRISYFTPAVRQYCGRYTVNDFPVAKKKYGYFLIT